MTVFNSLDKSQAVIHYRFTRTACGVTMELWEPKSSAIVGEPPYRFRLKRKFMSEREACDALQEYLAANPTTLAIADHLDEEIINPYETMVVSAAR